MSDFREHPLVRFSHIFDQMLSSPNQRLASVTGLHCLGRPVPTAIALGIALACIDGGMSGCLYGALDAAMRSTTNNDAGAITAGAAVGVVGSQYLMNGICGAIGSGAGIASSAIYSGGHTLSGAVARGGRLVSCGQGIRESLRLAVIAGCLAVIRSLTTAQEQCSLGFYLLLDGLSRR
ncbi:MAG: hypothetical protein ACO3K7_03055 [Candidatus Marinamargulisbacteria bacterium]